MYEVEVKVEAEHDAVRERLSELDARALGSVTQADTYYDAPHRDFAETDEALRVRREHRGDEHDETEAVAKLTYKGPLVEAESKTREEFETEVADGAVIATILSRVSFEPAATVTKHRERYELRGLTVTLDDVEGLGEYIEVETEADESEIEAARTRAYDLLSDVGLDPESQIRTSYLGLLLGASE